MVCIAIEEQIGLRAGYYLRAFPGSHAVALGDALIAATASVHHVQLWTRNRKQFPMKDVQFFNSNGKAESANKKPPESPRTASSPLAVW